MVDLEAAGEAVDALGVQQIRIERFGRCLEEAARAGRHREGGAVLGTEESTQSIIRPEQVFAGDEVQARGQVVPLARRDGEIRVSRKAADTVVRLDAGIVIVRRREIVIEGALTTAEVHLVRLEMAGPKERRAPRLLGGDGVPRDDVATRIARVVGSNAVLGVVVSVRTLVTSSQVA